jgi:2-polyprenyl-3-methyl-5-hydroxy-6-metoxy-1,4-benzoquinol methylase
LAIELNDRDARIYVRPAADGRLDLHVVPHSESFFVARNRCRTRYSLELIRLILEVKGPGYLCDEISRDEDDTYVTLNLENCLFAYVESDALAHSRILDFGCGCGASSVILARMFPSSRIVGIDLLEEHLRVARARAVHHALENVEFLSSPAANELPPDLGSFDHILLSAVYEHLLPDERRTMLPKLWSVLETHGTLLITETPHRWFFSERHTTGLPLLNYVPRAVALRAARRLSRRVDPTVSWPDLLRAGIRGGTKREILRILASASNGGAAVLEPRRVGIDDQLDLWFSLSAPVGKARRKRLAKGVLKLVKRATGEEVVPDLCLAVRKRS